MCVVFKIPVSWLIEAEAGGIRDNHLVLRTPLLWTMSVLWAKSLSDSLQPSVHQILQARKVEWVACPSPGDLPDPGVEPLSLVSPEPAGEFFTTSAAWAKGTWANPPLCLAPGPLQVFSEWPLASLCLGILLRG